MEKKFKMASMEKVRKGRVTRLKNHRTLKCTEFTHCFIGAIYANKFHFTFKCLLSLFIFKTAGVNFCSEKRRTDSLNFNFVIHRI